MGPKLWIIMVFTIVSPCWTIVFSRCPIHWANLYFATATPSVTLCTSIFISPHKVASQNLRQLCFAMFFSLFNLVFHRCPIQLCNCVYGPDGAAGIFRNRHVEKLCNSQDRLSPLLSNCSISVLSRVACVDKSEGRCQFYEVFCTLMCLSPRTVVS